MKFLLVLLLGALSLLAQPQMGIQTNTFVYPVSGNDATGVADSFELGYVFVETNDPSYFEGLFGGTGWRKLVTFTLTIINFGDEDWIGPSIDTNPELFVFEPAPGHGHYHLIGWSEFTLFNQQGRKVAVNQKLGWCVEPGTAFIFPWSDYIFGAYDCLHPQMLRGWGDTYAAHIFNSGTTNAILTGAYGMWFDITGLPDGDYVAKFELDPNHLYGPYANCFALVPVRLEGDTWTVLDKLKGKGRFK